jgi:hypothetical protein
LPSLKTFIFLCMWKVESEMGDCLVFCRTHGRNLRTLSFWPAVFVNSPAKKGPKYRTFSRSARI